MNNFRRRALLGLAFACAVAAFGILRWRHGTEIDAAPVAAAIAPAVPAAITPKASAPSPATKLPADSILPPLPKEIRGFRTGRRSFHREYLAATENFALALQELERMANAGDADAAGTLAEYYRKCTIAAEINDPENDDLLRVLGADAQLSDGQIEGLQAHASGRHKRCQMGMADPGRSSQLAEAWAMRAAILGDPWSRLLLPHAASVLTTRREAALDLLRQGGPEGLIRFAPMLEVVAGQYSTAAFVMAGCTLIEACASDVEGYGRRTLAIEQLAGMEGSIRSLQLLSPREREVTAGQSDRILRLWQSGQLEPMLTPPAPPRP